MIIIEGADNCGKSTLVKQLLALDPSLRLLHRERFKPKNNETIATSYLNALMPPADGNRLAHANSLADRFLASECIYGELFRGGCRMTAREHFLIKLVLGSYSPVIVFCNPPDDAITSTWQQRDQLYDNPLVIANAYRRRFKKIFAPFPVVEYNWTSIFAKGDRETIIEEHRERTRRIHKSLLLPISHCSEDV